MVGLGEVDLGMLGGGDVFTGLLPHQQLWEGGGKAIIAKLGLGD